MLKNNKFAVLLVLITLSLLCLGAVSANEAANDTTKIVKEDATLTQNVIKDTDKITAKSDTTINKSSSKDKTIEKTNRTNVKTASKAPVSFDIIIRSNIVDNTTIDVGVIDFNTKKAVANSDLKLELPDNSTISTKTTKSGYVNVTMKLPYSKNTVKITYPGSSKYYPYDYDLELNVSKRYPNMHVNVDGSNTTGNVNLTVELTDTVTGSPIKNAKTTLSLSDGRTFTKNTNSKATALFSFKLNEGRNYLNVTYAGNKTYKSAKANLTLDIGKVKNNVDYDVVLNNLVVGKTSLAVIVKDYDTRKVLPNTPIKLKIQNGKTYSGKTDKTGTFSTAITAPAGKNYMSIIFDGNSTYYSRTEKINFTVSKRVSNMSLAFDDTYNKYKLDISLKDLILNKTINNAPVTIKLPDGKNVSLKTNSKGVAAYTITPIVGTKTYKVSYGGNANVTSVSRTLKITTPKSKTNVNFNVTVTNRFYRDDTVVFTLIDSKTNKTMSKSNLTIKLPFKTVTATTNSKGQVTLKTNMSVGTNKVYISYPGNTKYSPRNATVDIKIDKRPTIIKSAIAFTDLLKIDLNLTDAITNKPISYVKVYLKHPSQTVTFKTDANGQVSENVVLPVGSAEISAFYNGNSIYNKSNVLRANITIQNSNKKATVVTLNPVSGTLGEKVTLTANVKGVDGKKVTSGDVVFKLDGITLKTDNTFKSKAAIKRVAVKNGKASVTLVADKNLMNVKNLTASYSGSSSYFLNDSKIVQANIQLRKASVIVTATPKTQQHYKAVTFKVKVSDIVKAKKTVPANNNNSYVYFKINGKTLKDSKSKTVKAKVVNGIATYKYTIPKATAGVTATGAVKKYTVTAVYSNPDYANASNKTVYKVNRSATAMTFSKVQYTKKTRTLVVTGYIKDYKKYNLVGNVKVTLKVNGKAITKNNKAVTYTVKNGKINLKVKLPSSFKSVTKVTLTSANTVAYLKTSKTSSNVKQA